MKKLIPMLLLVFVIHGCDGGPGSRLDEQMAAPQVTANFDPATKCVTLQWDPIYTAHKYRIERYCINDCRDFYNPNKVTVSPYVIETTQTKYTNCPSDSGDAAFYIGWGNKLQYSVNAYVDGAGGIGTTWGPSAPAYFTPQLFPY